MHISVLMLPFLVQETDILCAEIATREQGL